MWHKIAAAFVVGLVWVGLTIPLLTGKPSKVAPIDLTGIYLSARNGGEPLYRVTVERIGGVLTTSWVAIGQAQPTYLGRLDLQPDGTYTEVYAVHIALNRCGPWVWTVYRDVPLSLHDHDGPMGWDLIPCPPDSDRHAMCDINGVQIPTFHGAPCSQPSSLNMPGPVGDLLNSRLP